MILRIRCFLMKEQHIYFPTTNHMVAQNPELRPSFPNLIMYCFVFLLGSAVSFLRGVVTEQIKYNTTQIHTGNTFYQVDISKQFIVTFPAGWSPQQVVIVKESFPKWPKHSGEGFLINCPDYFHLYEFPSGVSPTYQ